MGTDHCLLELLLGSCWTLDYCPHGVSYFQYHVGHLLHVIKLAFFFFFCSEFLVRIPSGIAEEVYS